MQPFADALFAMQKGEIRGPVKTQFGYHVILLEDVAAGAPAQFDEVRAELEADYRNEQAQALFYEKSQQLADDAFAALSELDSVAKKQGLTLQTVEGYTRQGGGPFADNRKVIDAVFSDEVLQERQNSPAVNVATTTWSCCASRTTSRPHSGRWRTSVRDRGHAAAAGRTQGGRRRRAGRRSEDQQWSCNRSRCEGIRRCPRRGHQHRPDCRGR